jgi:hypothetical protein
LIQCLRAWDPLLLLSQQMQTEALIRKVPMIVEYLGDLREIWIWEWHHA